jgi:hypothetical protein
VIGPSVNAAQQGGFGVSADRTVILVFCLVTFSLVYIFLFRSRVRLLEREDALAVRKAALVEAS